MVGLLRLLRARMRCQVSWMLLANTFHQPRPQGARGRLRFLSPGHPAPVTEMPLETVNRGAASQQSLFNGILTPTADELVCRSGVKESVASHPLVADLSRDHDHATPTREPAEVGVARCYLTGWPGTARLSGLRRFSSDPWSLLC